jgi:hypothetical protein
MNTGGTFWDFLFNSAEKKYDIQPGQSRNRNSYLVYKSVPEVGKVPGK